MGRYPKRDVIGELSELSCGFFGTRIIVTKEDKREEREDRTMVNMMVGGQRAADCLDERMGQG